MAIIIHYVPEFNFFWAEAGKEHKDTLKSAGFNWCDLSYGPKWCPPEKSGINKKWWTKNYANAYKLKDHLSPDAARAINEWIESGGAEKEISEAETPISIHYIPETKIFFADAGKRFAKILKDAGFRWHDIEWSEHNISKCAACAGKVPSKRWWTNNIDSAVNLINFADAGAKEVLDKYLLIIEQSRAAESNIEVPLPEGKKPYKYQKAGIGWFLSRDNSLMADDQGLGKSLQSLALINMDVSIKTVIILCLTSLKINWKKECAMWLTRPYKATIVSHVEDIPKRKPDDDETVSILIIGFPAVRGDYGKELYDKLMTFNYDLLIIDEAHNLKNPKALQTRNILGWSDLKEPFEEHKGIAHGARKKIYLSGTPIKNRPIEGWTIFHSLAPEIFDNYIKYAFRYCNAYWEEVPVKGKGLTKTLNVKGSSNSDELQRKLRASIMIRRLKEDVLTELPLKTRELVILEPDAEARKLIEEENRRSVSILQMIDKASKAKSDEEYKNISNNLEEDKPKFEEISKVRHQLALLKLDAIYEYVQSMIESMPEGKDKIILFAHHRDVIEKLVEKFRCPSGFEFDSETNSCVKKNKKGEIIEKIPNQVVFLYGGMKPEERDKAVVSFQTDPNIKIFIGSISAAGTGLTLHASSTVLFCELDWAPSQIIQAEDRAHRIGQKDNVLVQHLVFDGSLDAKIIKTFLNKMDVISKILDVGAEVKKITIQDIPKVEPIPEPGELKPIPIPTIVKAEYKPGEQTEQGGVVIDAGPSKPSKPGQPPTKPVIIEYTYTDEQKQAALQGLQMLAEVCDYAQTKDMMGFNKTYTTIGHELASVDELSDRDMSGEHGAVHILNVHRRQMPDWIRDILGLWPNKEKAIYTPEQKRVIYMVAQLLNESPDKEQIFDEQELQLIKEIAETDTTEYGDKTFSDKLLFVFRNIISEHWTDIDPNATALLEHVGVKRAKIRGKHGETNIEPTIPGEEELAEEKISKQPEEKAPRSEPPKSILVDFVEMGKQAYSKGIKRVPSLDLELNKILRSFDDKNKITKAYEHWLKGWDQANLAAPVIPEIPIPIKKEEPTDTLIFHAITKDRNWEIKLYKHYTNKYWMEYKSIPTKSKDKKSVKSTIDFGNATIGEVTNAINNLINQTVKEQNVVYEIKKNDIEYTKPEPKPIPEPEPPKIVAPPEEEVGYVFIAATKNKEYEIDVLKDSHGKYLVDYIKEGKSVRSFSTTDKDELIEHISKYISNAATKGINYIVGIDNELLNISIPTPEKPHKETIVKLTEPQKGGLYSIIVYFSTLSDSTLKKEFSDIERKIFDKIENDLGEGKSWEVLNDEQINELKRLIEKHTNLVPKEYMNYLTATGIRLIQPSAPIIATATGKQYRYTNQQKDIAYMSIIMLKKHFDSLTKKEKAQYTKEWIDNIDRIAQFAQPISDEQVDQIISVIKKHRRLFDEMGVFEKLGVKFVGRPPKQ